jgi:hypothetical protein
MRPLALASLLFMTDCGVRESGLEVHVSAAVESPVRLQTATLALEQLELQRCEERSHWWSPLVPISTAWAHDVQDGSTNPRRLEVPILIDLTRSDLIPIGSLTPPPGSICGLTLTFAPSTADAREQGTTLFLEGTGYRQLSTKRVQVSLPLDHLQVDEDHKVQSLKFKVGAFEPIPSGDASLTAVVGAVRW